MKGKSVGYLLEKQTDRKLIYQRKSQHQEILLKKKIIGNQHLRLEY